MTEAQEMQPDLVELRELHAKATEGPWLVGTGGGGGATTYVYESDDGQQCRAIASCTLDYVERPMSEREANARFIAATKRALPTIFAALDEAARMRERVERLTSELKLWRSLVRTVLVISRYDADEGDGHHYIHWPRERFCWFKDQPHV
jgi:hypothetical protein